ncbi:Uu.00g082220.m01.CDS01 [Anthostomella pinea]|uniref:Uu.00g082220.m01.CDS01 n=1 Tax=Anthostomella pinea TaxID=933095 RepID=A0AAI8YJD5_9PEZI|nr:Uu.00g082220.m01.CDS01 [Anthostomella pinea]
MPFKIFVTGATGYIGGDALYALSSRHPEFEYALLVRTQEKADAVQKKYPQTRIVLGELGDAELLKKEAARADIVIHTADASDNEGAAKAIAEGLVEGHTASKPGYWLHTGGSGILTYFDSEADRLGEWEEKEFNDYSGVEELTHLPDEAFHRNVDQIVLKCGTEHADVVKTAIVCPPTIYGEGRGPISGRGRQVYELAKLVLQKGYAPVIGKGKARWNNIHVHDLSEAFRLLVEAAVFRNGSKDLWGDKGYYFVERGEHVWGDLARTVAGQAKELGFIKSDEEYQLGKDEALNVAGFEAVSWGLNSRGKAERLNKVLGWTPRECSMEEEVPRILKAEKERLG